MDRCFYCQGTMENSYTSYMADLEGQYVIIKNVPCHKWKQCSEVSYSSETVARIEEIIKTLTSALTQVAIVEYAA